MQVLNRPNQVLSTSGAAQKCAAPLKLSPVSRGAVIAGATAPVSSTIKVQQLKSRSYRRDLYDHDKWVGHRSEDRYLKNITTIPGSRIVRSLWGPLAWVASVSTALCVYEVCRANGTLPDYLPSLAMSNNQPQVLTSFALSLLLVFRTNSSYGRWDEARKMWGGILNRTRNIMTQTMAWYGDEESRQAMFRWTCAFTRALQSHLQEDADLRTNLKSFMQEEEIEMIMSSPHKVVKTCQVLGEIINQQKLNMWQGECMTDNITFFYDALGGCERILRTPIPVSYTRHTSRFLTMWMTFLPFGMVGSAGWGTIPISVAIGLLLFGIDEIGMQIEEPFGILALDAIAGRAETDARQQLKEGPQVNSYISEIAAKDAAVRDLATAARN